MTASAQSNSGSAFPLSEGDPTTYDWKGAYGKLGLSIGVPNQATGVADVDAGAAVAFAGGYRFNRWLALEVDMNITAGHDVEGSNDDAVIFAFTINSKTYPLAESALFPEWVQPYFLFGFGGGSVDGGGNGDESSFMMRFNVGSEFMLWDHFGLFAEGGYLTIDDAETGLDGTGQIILGGVYRF